MKINLNLKLYRCKAVRPFCHRETFKGRAHSIQAREKLNSI